MRHYQKLDHITFDESNGTLLFTSSDTSAKDTTLWFGREGMYVSVSAGNGPLEVALRPRQQDLINALSQIAPTERLAVRRMVGTGQAHLELGLSADGELLLRTTIVADATGHFALNMILTKDARKALFEWLGVENKALV